MKSIIQHLSIMSIGVTVLAACSNDGDLEIAEICEEPTAHTVTVRLDISRSGFDDDGDSRAASYAWNDGDVVYLRFNTDNGVVIGNATYKAEQGDWTVNYYGTLGTSSTVEVTHFSSLPLCDGDVVELSSNTAIYQDLQATYAYAERTLSISANLLPITSRIRLKGVEKQDYASVGGLTHYAAYDISSGEFTTDTRFVHLYASADLYTDYVYGVCTDSDTRQIKVNRDGDVYTMSCPADMLQVGKSGWIDIPTTASHNGWTAKRVCGVENGHLWVDLGLPSGTKWADENVGADLAQYQDDLDVSNVYGGYYTYSERITIGASWGGNWHIPTPEQVDELRNYGIWSWTEDYFGGLTSFCGYEIEGVSGEYFFLPAAGGHRPITGIGEYGYYYTSGTTTNTYLLDFSCTEIRMYNGGYFYNGCSIRPVID